MSPKRPALATETKFTFTAEINSIEMYRVAKDPLPSYLYDLKEVREAGAGTLVIGFDAHWAVRTTVRNVEGTNPLFHVGDEFVFVVHSPTAIFPGSADEAKGKIVRMDLFGTAEKDGRIGFHALHYHFENTAKTTTANRP